MTAVNLNRKTFDVYQSNGRTVTFRLTQDGSGQLGGSAIFPDHTGEIGDNSVVRGESIIMRVNWHPGDSVGVYTGNFTLDKRLAGVCFDETHPANTASWTSGSI